MVKISEKRNKNNLKHRMGQVLPCGWGPMIHQMRARHAVGVTCHQQPASCSRIAWNSNCAGFIVTLEALAAILRHFGPFPPVVLLLSHSRLPTCLPRIAAEQQVLVRDQCIAMAKGAGSQAHDRLWCVLDEQGARSDGLSCDQ
jgi:hypothetical protein